MTVQKFLIRVNDGTAALQPSDSETSEDEGPLDPRRPVDARNPLKGEPTLVLVSSLFHHYSGHNKAITVIEITQAAAESRPVALSASLDKLIKAWDVSSGKVIHVCCTNDEPTCFKSIVFSVVPRARFGRFIAWNPATRKCFCQRSHRWHCQRLRNNCVRGMSGYC